LRIREIEITAVAAIVVGKRDVGLEANSLFRAVA
jgi:hypothetical protein